MKLHAMANDSRGYLENTLFWELEENDYDFLDVPEECMRIVRELHDPKYLGKPMPVNRKFDPETNMPVHYIMDNWPYKHAPMASMTNGRTGVSTEAQKPDPDYSTWNAYRDRINMWHDRMSRNVGRMCNMYWAPDFPKLNHNAVYEIRNGGLAQVGGAIEECKEKETEQASKPYKPSAPVDTSNPSEWQWKYSEVPFPETMAQVEKMVTPLKKQGNHYGWDFGKYMIPPPSNVPSLARSISCIKKYHLFAIARALVLRSRDISFPWQYVYNSTKESTVNNSRIAPYRETMIRAADSGTTAEAEIVLAACDEIVGYYKKYLEGNVRNESKKFADITGKPWDIKHFVIELRENIHVELKRLGKPGKKEGR